MANKYVWSDLVRESDRDRALAEVILLSVTLAKSLFVEKAYCLEAGPGYVHAEPNSTGSLNQAALIDAGNQAIQILIGDFQRVRVVLQELGITANSRVVG